MFYSQFILAKKGPLGTIWIAAHLERKLRKNQVTETNISVSVDSILFPEVPIALRLSGHLLLGVVRIYSRKVNYLFHDCSEALLKIKQAFHSGAVDLPPEAATAPFHSITLPETFDLDEFEPLLDRELNLLHTIGGVDHHVSSREQITLQDPLEDNGYLGSQFEFDERFPEADAPRLGLDFDEDLLEKSACDTSSIAVTLEEEEEEEEEEEVALEEDVIPPTAVDVALDYDKMDTMDVMDFDDHREPDTPGLGVEEMDVDYQQDVDQLEESEQAEPHLHGDDEGLDDLQVDSLQPVLLKCTTPPWSAPTSEPQSVNETNTDLRDDVEADLEKLVEENNLEREILDGVVQQGTLEKQVIEEEWGDEKQETGGPEEEQEGDRDCKEKDDAQNEVPGQETLMSAPECVNQNPGVFDIDNDTDIEQHAFARDCYNRDQNMEEETVPVLQEEDPLSVTAEGITPVRSPPLPTISSDYLPGDDDVLASLLGRGTTALKVLPTPIETIAKPRKKQGQRKRKIVMDITTILGADVMKQQLMDTDDIRRIRRKAPCTRQELWHVQKEALSQQIFCEHSVPGMCGELRVLFEQVFVVGEAKLPLADATGAEAREIASESQPGPVVEDLNKVLDEMADPPAEVAVVEEEVQFAVHEYQQVDDNRALDVVLQVSPFDLTDAAPVQDLVLRNAPSPLPPVEPEKGQNSVPKEYAMDVLEAEMKPDDLNFGSLEMAETAEASAVEYHPLTNVTVENALGKESVRMEGEVNVFELVNTDAGVEDQFVPSAETDIEGIIVPVSELEAEVEKEMGSKTEVEANVSIEIVDETEAKAVADVQGGAGPLAACQDREAEELKTQEEEQMTTSPEEEVGTEVTASIGVANAEEQLGDEGLGFLADIRNTEFLGADDDDLAVEAEDFQDANEYSQKEAIGQDNSGWSARTRAVGHYLRVTLEDKDAFLKKRHELGIAKLGLERMLVGKSRKEAARMFFETLVLKTKDYIHVEQDAPYGDIQISARPKLMKAKY